MITLTRAEALAELANGGRIRFLQGTHDDANGGFVVLDRDHYPGEPVYVADVREGWAGGVYEPICAEGDAYLFDRYLSDYATWIDRGTWVRVRIEGCTGGPAERLSTR